MALTGLCAQQMQVNMVNCCESEKETLHHYTEAELGSGNMMVKLQNDTKQSTRGQDFSWLISQQYIQI